MNETIRALTETYETALTVEYSEKMATEDAHGEAESFKANILFLAEKDGQISGKNKDTRDQQRAAVLAGDLDYASAEKAAVEANCRVTQAEIKRKVVEAQIGLTKAFWYSQSGKP